MKIVITLTY